MDAASEILHQLEFLQDSRNEWVRHPPRLVGEGCLLFRVEANDYFRGLTIRAASFVAKVLDISEPWAVPKLLYWNDADESISYEDVILTLKKAYELALEDKCD